MGLRWLTTSWPSHGCCINPASTSARPPLSFLSSRHPQRHSYDPIRHLRTMAADAAIPGLFFAFAAMLLLIFASVSSPTWEAISFLNTNVGGTITHFGVFGFTGSATSVGWFFPAGVADSRLNSTLFHNLTEVLILIPISAGLSGLAFLFGVCGASYHRVGTVFMTLLTSLAFLTTLIAWVDAMALFGIARDHVRNAGNSAQYGNANWLVLGALISLFLGFFASCCGVFGRYRSTRRPGY